LLSIVTLLLVFASNVVTLVHDLQAFNQFQAGKSVSQIGFNATVEGILDGDYIPSSSIPNQPAGVFWAVLNRLLIVAQVTFCCSPNLDGLRRSSIDTSRLWERVLGSGRWGLCNAFSVQQSCRIVSTSFLSFLRFSCSRSAVSISSLAWCFVNRPGQAVFHVVA
ncbi:unnamed protein product, partial [Mycena citricolor]